MAKSERFPYSTAGQVWFEEIDKRVQLFFSQFRTGEISSPYGRPRTRLTYSEQDRYTWVIPDTVIFKEMSAHTEIKIRLGEFYTEKDRRIRSYRNAPRKLSGYVVGTNPITLTDNRNNVTFSPVYGPVVGPWGKADFYEPELRAEKLDELSRFLPEAWNRGHDLAKQYRESMRFRRP